MASHHPGRSHRHSTLGADGGRWLLLLEPGLVLLRLVAARHVPGECVPPRLVVAAETAALAACGFHRAAPLDRSRPGSLAARRSPCQGGKRGSRRALDKAAVLRGNRPKYGGGAR